MKKEVKIGLRVVTVLLCSLVGRSAGAQSCGVKPELQRVVAEKYPGWSLLEASQLNAEDRAIWFRDYKGLCPGWTKGGFLNGREAFALNLVKRSGTRWLQQLVVGPADLTPRDFFTVVAPGQADVLSVIEKVPPGHYHDAITGKETSIRTDSVAWTEIEAASTLYYWAAGRFVHMTLSE